MPTATATANAFAEPPQPPGPDGPRGHTGVDLPYPPLVHERLGHRGRCRERERERPARKGMIGPPCQVVCDARAFSFHSPATLFFCRPPFSVCFPTSTATFPQPSVPGIPPVHTRMADFKLCSWPPPLDPLTPSVAERLDSLNNDLGGWEAAERTARGSGEPVVSFSHFLPRLELIPEKR